jgi:hypothetical protein
MNAVIDTGTTMERNVDLSGGPLAGYRWPARPGVDRTLWIGIGADGGEYDGRGKLTGIAIYERAPGDEADHYNFARLEGPGARIAELGRRITALRTIWATHRHYSAPYFSAYGGPMAAEQSPALRQPPPSRDAADASITRSVIERWQRDFNAAAASGRRIDGQAYLGFIVPGEAEQFAELLFRHGIPTTLAQTTTLVRRADSDDFEPLPTGNVLFAPQETEQIARVLQATSSA